LVSWGGAFARGLERGQSAAAGACQLVQMVAAILGAFFSGAAWNICMRATALQTSRNLGCSLSKNRTSPPASIEEQVATVGDFGRELWATWRIAGFIGRFKRSLRRRLQAPAWWSAATGKGRLAPRSPFVSATSRADSCSCKRWLPASTPVSGAFAGARGGKIALLAGGGSGKVCFEFLYRIGEICVTFSVGCIASDRRRFLSARYS